MHKLKLLVEQKKFELDIKMKDLKKIIGNLVLVLTEPFVEDVIGKTTCGGGSLGLLLGVLLLLLGCGLHDVLVGVKTSINDKKEV